MDRTLKIILELRLDVLDLLGQLGGLLRQPDELEQTLRGLEANVDLLRRHEALPCGRAIGADINISEHYLRVADRDRDHAREGYHRAKELFGAVVSRLKDCPDRRRYAPSSSMAWRTPSSASTR
jgi:hypothetical protein